MPVTATLSREFYEKFGDTVVIELINLLNTVDADSKATLRELNEANFARFDAGVKQQFAELETRVERRFAQQEERIDRRFAEIDGRLAGLETKIEALKAELIKWMFLFFTGSALANLLRH